MSTYLRNLRENNNLTIEEVSDRTAIPIDYLLDLENGRTKKLINGGRIFKLSEVLQISLDELLEIIENDIGK